MIHWKKWCVNGRRNGICSAHSGRLRLLKRPKIDVLPVSLCYHCASTDSSSTCLRTWKCSRTYCLAVCRKSEKAGNEEYDPCAGCASARNSCRSKETDRKSVV